MAGADHWKAPSTDDTYKLQPSMLTLTSVLSFRLTEVTYAPWVIQLRDDELFLYRYGVVLIIYGRTKATYVTDRRKKS